MAVVVPIISEWDPKGLQKAGSDIKRAEGGFAKTGAAFKAALLPAAAGLAGVAAAGVKFANMAAEDAANAAKMAKALENVTGATDEQVAAVEDWITAQGKALGVSDDELRPAIQTLAQATGDLGQAQRDAALAMDIAAASGSDTETAAKAIAKAYDGSYGSLKKLVPGIDDAALASKDFGKIMESTGKIVGGQAADAAETAAGQQKRLSLSLAETGESIGAALLPVLEKLLPILQKIASFISDNTGLVVGLGAAFAAIAATIVVVNAAMTAYGVVMAVVEANQKRAAAGQWALNAAFLANPVVLIVAGIVALIAALVIAYKKSETFRRIVDAAFAAVKTAVLAFVDAVKAVFSWLARNWKTIVVILVGPIAIAVALIVKHWDKIKAGAAKVLSWLRTTWSKVSDLLTEPFRIWWSVVSGIIDKIKGAIQNVLDLIGRIKLPSLPDLNPFSRAAPASVTGLRASYASPTATASGGSSTMNLSVSGAVDAEGTARSIQRLLDRHSARQGRVTGAPARRAW